MTKATTSILFQRADGWCESVQDRVFPLFESAVKAARFVSFIIRYEWSPIGGKMGGNAEDIAFRPSVDVSMAGRLSHRGERLFVCYRQLAEKQLAARGIIWRSRV